MWYYDPLVRFKGFKRAGHGGMIKCVLCEFDFFINEYDIQEMEFCVCKKCSQYLNMDKLLLNKKGAANHID